MKAKTISSVVLEYFQVAGNVSGTTNDILKYYVEAYGKNNNTDLKKARHSIYLKIHRLMKSGKLIIKSKKGRTATFTLSTGNVAAKRKPKSASEKSSSSTTKEREVLKKRKVELQYELEICIAEAHDYEEMKSLIPSQSELLSEKKNEAKQRAIKLNGQLTSTQNILLAMSA